MSAFGENIRREIRSSRTAWAFAIVCLIGLFVQSKWDEYWLSRPFSSAVINGDTAYIGNFDPAAKAKEAVIISAKRAVRLIYGRVPERIEEEEELKRIVNTPTLNAIEKTWNDNKPAFLARRMTVDFHCEGDVKCVYINSQYVDALVTGDVFQDEIQDGRERTTHTKTRVILHFFINGEFATNHKWPYVVTGWEPTPL